ncbi:DNA-3-methyladenine glycosylase, partial [Streptomyces buecherae]
MTVGCDRTPLDRSFFDRPVLQVAPDLLGRILVRTTPQGPIEVRLTEVEAYAGASDPGSHCYRGRTERNASMFGPPGHAYVYFTYGMWHCLNLVCGAEGTPSGVLLRAGEIIRGQELARPRRAAARKDRELAQGPAQTSVPFSTRPTSSAVASRAGPWASSRSLRAAARRGRASSWPRMISPARSSTPLGVPSAPHTRLRQCHMP